MWEKMGKIGDENFSTVRIARSGNRMDDPSAPMEMGRVEPIGTTSLILIWRVSRCDNSHDGLQFGV